MEEYKLHVDWSSVKERRRRLMQRDARPHTARGTDSSGCPPPWITADKGAARAAPPDQWTGASSSGSSRRGRQFWDAWGHQGASWTDADWEAKGR
eukprot:8109861-Pyramimonas_sp.AAC.1